jgi:type VI protein secretion system component VasK
MFFPHASRTPRVEFFLWFANLDPRVIRFWLNVEGVATDIRRGSASTKQQVSWPGNTHGFKYQFEGGTYKLPKQDGREWALFRLIYATGTANGDGQSVRLQLRDDQGYEVDAFVDASSATGNPFSDRTWRQFRCGA